MLMLLVKLMLMIIVKVKCIIARVLIKSKEVDCMRRVRNANIIIVLC
jgi:hypothetical protein